LPSSIFGKNRKNKYVCKTGRIRIPEAVIKYQLVGKRNSELPSERFLDCNIETGLGYEAQVLEIMVVVVMVVIFAVTGQ
jgi:hypothetical protein